MLLWEIFLLLYSSNMATAITLFWFQIFKTSKNQHSKILQICQAGELYIKAFVIVKLASDVKKGKKLRVLFLFQEGRDLV